jgi:hypothetical protein
LCTIDTVFVLLVSRIEDAHCHLLDDARIGVLGITHVAHCALHGLRSKNTLSVYVIQREYIHTLYAVVGALTAALTMETLNSFHHGHTFGPCDVSLNVYLGNSTRTVGVLGHNLMFIAL